MATETKKQYLYNTFVVMRAKYKALYDAVKKTHEDIVASGKTTMGHGWDHDLRVAQTSALIAETPRVGEMTWVVGLMHSTDRHFGSETSEVLDRYFGLLPVGEFRNDELMFMREALMEHSMRNSDADNPVTVTLKDADRLSNMGALNLIRGGQHRPNIPACIPKYLGRKHPQTTFRNIQSCYDAIWFNLEWEDMLRLPKAKEMGKPYFDYYRDFMSRCVEEMQSVGLYPFPEE
ncbi:MAG: HD domain-containing protein [Minisyncoccia bacterium]